MLGTAIMFCTIPSAFPDPSYELRQLLFDPKKDCVGHVLLVGVSIEVVVRSLSKEYYSVTTTEATKSFVQRVRKLQKGSSGGIDVKELGFDLSSTFGTMTEDAFEKANYKSNTTTYEMVFGEGKLQLYKITTVDIELMGQVARLTDEVWFHTVKDNEQWDIIDSTEEAERQIRREYERRIYEGKGEIYQNTYTEDLCITSK